MQVRSGRVAGHADAADDLSCGDDVANRDIRWRDVIVEMAVFGDVPAGVRDEDALGAVRMRADEGNDARRGGDDRRKQVNADVMGAMLVAEKRPAENAPRLSP